MASAIQAVSRSRHAIMRWRGTTDYRFAAHATRVPLAAAEIGSAALALPLALIQTGGNRWTLAAILGFKSDQNLCVDAAGNWHARHIPAVLRGYPFLMGSTPDGEAALYVDEGSGLVGEGIEGEAFYLENGEFHPNVARLANFLSETARSETLTFHACGILRAAGLIEPWPITLQTNQGAHQVEGLYRISEASLNALDVESFSTLRLGGALTVAYAQLLSMKNLNLLGHLAQTRDRAEAQIMAAQEANEHALSSLIYLPADSTIDWDWSKIGR